MTVSANLASSETGETAAVEKDTKWITLEIVSILTSVLLKILVIPMPNVKISSEVMNANVNMDSLEMMKLVKMFVTEEMRAMNALRSTTVKCPISVMIRPTASNRSEITPVNAKTTTSVMEHHVTALLDSEKHSEKTENQSV